VTETIVAEQLACARGGRVVVRGVRFALPPGRALVVSGPNGAGKSTLLRTLAGLAEPAEGALNGLPMCAFLGHLDGLKAALSVREQVRLAGAARAEEAIGAWGLDDLAELPVRMLSAGQRRRAALATVLATDAPLWLLDEPTTALDDAAVARFGRVCAHHLAHGGFVIAATHAPLPLPDPITLRLSS
jgi:heme exporter protein A